MASAPQSVSTQTGKTSPLTPELREFIDRAIVPALVKNYLEDAALAKTPAVVAFSDTSSTAATLRGRP